MSRRDSYEEQVHDQLIGSMVRYFEERGYVVLADHIGHPNGRPDSWKGYVPDIYAYDGNDKWYVEAETCGSYSDKHAVAQLKAFSSKPGTGFGLIVPSSCKDVAERHAKSKGVYPQMFWL